MCSYLRGNGCPSIHVDFTIRTNNLNFATHHLMNIHDKFGSNGPQGFGGRRLTCKKVIDNNRCKVMIIADMTLLVTQARDDGNTIIICWLVF